MVRSLVMAALLVCAALWMVGCGGGDAQEGRGIGKPITINPADLSMGAQKVSSFWAAKTEVGGETRVYLFDDRAMDKVGGSLQYDEEEQIFYDKGRKHTYDLTGTAKHTIAVGPNKGQPAVPLRQRAIKMNPETGQIEVVGGAVKPEDRNNPLANAYVVVQ